MNCWRTRQMLAAFLDGELSPAEAQLVDEHLGECPECAELRDRIAALPPLELPRLDPDDEAAIWSKMDAALDDAWERHERGELSGVRRSVIDAMRGWLRSGRLSLPIPVAAAYVVIIVGLTALNLYTFQRVRSLSVASEDATAQSAPATHARTLPPGTAAAIGARPFSSSIVPPLSPVADDDTAEEEAPELSVPVIDSTTGRVLYHVVDEGYPVQY